MYNLEEKKTKNSTNRKKRKKKRGKRKKEPIAMRFAKGTRSLGGHPPKLLWNC